MCPVPTISAARPAPASGIEATESPAEQFYNSIPLRLLRHLIPRTGKKLVIIASTLLLHHTDTIVMASEEPQLLSMYEAVWYN